MELPSSDEIHRLTVQEFDTSKLLAHASRQARQRNYSDFMIVDIDSHHYETDHLSEIYQYIEEPVIRQLGKAFQSTMGLPMFPQRRSDQEMGGRITRSALRRMEKSEFKDGGRRDIDITLRWMDAMGVDYTCLFPTPMLSFGLHPQIEVEVALSKAYNRWLCERVLAREPRIVSLLYLPFNDPDASYQAVKEFGDKKGVVGFLVTGVRYNAVHDNEYMKTYALIEEMGKPLAFHAAYNWNSRYMEQMNRFISVHALGFPYYNILHMTNLVINGILFELLICSRRHIGALTDLNEMETRFLAQILKHTASAYDRVFDAPFPYSMGFHQAPTGVEGHPEWHFHAHFYPPLLRSASVRKFMVGFEMLGTPQRDITPESAAERLRLLCGNTTQ